ncbi:MAG: peptidylprolyl isomerase [Sediminibacterium sp.]|nr:peptidylprolyl isomerase [Sediminibacterium sp.]
MKEVQHGSFISVHYTGKLHNGDVFDSSIQRDPLRFKAGAGQMIAGFDKGVMGMKVGEKKTIQIPFLEGYGAIQEELIYALPISSVPDHIKPTLGLELSLTNQEGNNFQVRVIEITPEHIRLDANHFLAGKDLIFEVEVVEIN